LRGVLENEHSLPSSRLRNLLLPGKTCGDPAYIARKGLFVLR